MAAGHAAAGHAAAGHAAADPAPGPAAHDPSRSPVPGPEHLHDALVGCVLALVGVAALVVAAGVLLRGRAPAVRRDRSGRSAALVARLRRLLDPGPPLLLSLCVQRV